MEEEDFEEADTLLDEAEDEFEDNSELREAQLDQYGTIPEPQKTESIYTWFWRVVRLQKPFHLIKVGYLTKDEIGTHPMPTREAMNLWVLGNTFDHPTFADYFAKLAKITSATSMSKDGWLMNLSISQKKVRERAKSHQLSESWRIFSKRKKPIQESQF